MILRMRKMLSKEGSLLLWTSSKWYSEFSCESDALNVHMKELCLWKCSGIKEASPVLLHRFFSLLYPCNDNFLAHWITASNIEWSQGHLQHAGVQISLVFGSSYQNDMRLPSQMLILAWNFSLKISVSGNLQFAKKVPILLISLVFVEVL